MSIARLDDYWVGQGPTHQILRWKQCQDQPLARSEIPFERVVVQNRSKGSNRESIVKLRTIVETFRAPTGMSCFSTCPCDFHFPKPNPISQPKIPNLVCLKMLCPQISWVSLSCINLNCHKTGAITFPTSDTVDSLNIKVMLILTNPILQNIVCLLVYVYFTCLLLYLMISCDIWCIPWEKSKYSQPRVANDKLNALMLLS